MITVKPITVRPITKGRTGLAQAFDQFIKDCDLKYTKLHIRHERKD